LLSESDLVIAGPYDRTQPLRHPLLASENQRLVHLTERYRGCRYRGGRRVEYRIARGGLVRATGFAAAGAALRSVANE
jgi:anaerobic ribonucleoside-triphosphate reductase activating protein